MTDLQENPVPIRPRQGNDLTEISSRLQYSFAMLFLLFTAVGVTLGIYGNSEHYWHVGIWLAVLAVGMALGQLQFGNGQNAALFAARFWLGAWIAPHVLGFVLDKLLRI